MIAAPDFVIPASDQVEGRLFAGMTVVLFKDFVQDEKHLSREMFIIK